MGWYGRCSAVRYLADANCVARRLPSKSAASPRRRPPLQFLAHSNRALDRAPRAAVSSGYTKHTHLRPKQGPGRWSRRRTGSVCRLKVAAHGKTRTERPRALETQLQAVDHSGATSMKSGASSVTQCDLQVTSIIGILNAHCGLGSSRGRARLRVVISKQPPPAGNGRAAPWTVRGGRTSLGLSAVSSEPARGSRSERAAAPPTAAGHAVGLLSRESQAQTLRLSTARAQLTLDRRAATKIR